MHTPNQSKKQSCRGQDISQSHKWRNDTAKSKSRSAKQGRCYTGIGSSQFIANVFDAVKVRPNIKSKTTNNDSYIQKLQSRQSAIKSTVETTVIPMLPRNTAISGCEKCTVIAEANTMDTALMPKHKLNIMGENP